MNNSDPTNASLTRIRTDATLSYLEAAINGTGTYLPLTIFTNGSERVRIDTSGNVGIGTSSPTSKVGVISDGVPATSGNMSTGLYVGASNSYGINIGGSSSGAYAWINAAFLNNSGTAAPLVLATGSTERMRIDSSGNVGIGTSSPGTKLDVVGNMVLSGQSTADQFFRVGANRSGNGYSFIDLQGDTTYSNGLRLIRLNTGANAGSSIESRGTGAFQIVTQEAAPIVFFTNGGNERMRIDSSGNLLIGTTSAPADDAAVNAKVFRATDNFVLGSHRSTTSALPHYYFFNTNGLVGKIETNGSATAYITSSDYRLKENIAPMTGALDKVAELKPVTYNWKIDGSNGQGFIAHELAEVCPEAVSGEKDAVDIEGKPVYQGIDTSFLVATLTAAIQEQQVLIENLTTRLNALEGK
jgi:hypothetical protein